MLKLNMLVQKPLQKIVLLVCLLWLVGCDDTQTHSESAESTGGWLLMDGSILSRGTEPPKLLLINYWAEWCKPCVAEIPHLNQLAKSYAQQLDVVGVNYDGLGVEALRRSADKLGIEYSVAVENIGKQWLSKRPEALPVTLVIGLEGGLCASLLGEQTLDTLIEASMHCGLEEGSL